MGDIKLHTDPEIIGRIYLQYCEIKGALTEDQNNGVFPIIHSIMNKFAILKYHKDNFTNKLNSKMKSLAILCRKYRDKPEKLHEEENIDLIAEVEAFFFQIKSCLDVVVKMLKPICGVSYGSVYTFGEKGEKVISILKNNIPKKYEQEKVDALIKMIGDDKGSWMNSSISIRDKLSHEESIKMFVIKIAKLPNGSLVPLAPTINNHNVVSLLDLIYGNCIEFVQDFFFNIVLLMLPGILPIKANQDSLVASYGANEPVKYIKYQLALDPNKIKK